MVIVKRKELSPRQEDVLRFVKEYVKRNQWPPTIGEIAKGLGIASRSTVHSHLGALKAKGYIVIEPGSPRAIRIVA